MWKVIGICNQEKIYRECQECVACCVLADELLYSKQGYNMFFTEGVSVVYLYFLITHILCAGGYYLSLLGTLICMPVSV